MRRLEQGYVDRIIGLLSPLVGPGRIRATVAADIDFTVQEESSELYDPDGVVVRSEQLQENRNSPGSTNAGGIPGALSNQPPVQPVQVAEGAEVAAVDSTPPVNETVQQTRNNEISRTLSVTRRPSGTVGRLAVAVIVDEEALLENADQGAGSDELIGRVEELARQAVGFNAARGDTITVTGGTFYEAPPPTEIEEPSFFMSAGFRNTVMQVLSAVVLLVVGWGVVRPIVRMLTSPGSGAVVATGPAMLAAGPGGEAAARPAAQLNYGDKVAAAKQLVGHDSERVAEIVKGWVKADG